MRHLTTICFIILLNGCIPAKKFQYSGDWTGYEYSYFCPAYKFSENGKKYKPLNILNANHIALAKPGFFEAFDKANEYIKTRGGNSFFTNVKFNDVDITYLESAHKFDNKSPKYDLNKCGETRFYFRYTFSPYRNVNYHFGIALNDKLEIISKQVFPDINKSPDFANIISPLKAISIASENYKSVVKPLEKIMLIYDEPNNKFLWHLHGKKIHKKANNISEKEYAICNATTGKVIDIGKIIIRKNPHFFPDF